MRRTQPVAAVCGTDVTRRTRRAHRATRRRPCRLPATRSPTPRPSARRPRVCLLRNLDRSALADDDHLHLAGVLELVLDLAGDLVGEKNRPVVVEDRKSTRLNSSHLGISYAV